MNIGLMEGAQSSEYAGYLGSPMTHVPRHESEGSFVGGEPVWARGAAAAVACEACDRPMQQLVQLWAPLDNCPRRALHLFVCTQCRKPPGRWRVFRSHTTEPLQEEEEEKEGGEAAVKQTQVKEEIKAPSKPAALVPLDEAAFEALLAAQSKSGAGGQQGKAKGKNQKKKKSKARKKLPERAPVWSGGAVVPSWLEVEEKRPAKSKKKGISEAQADALAAAQEKMELEAKKDNESWGGEEWESGSRESKTFLAFQKMLQRDSQRVLRYQRAGQAAWIAEPPPQAPRACGKCGGRCVYEMHLLPTLLYLGGEAQLWQTTTDEAAAAIGEVQLPEAAVVDESAPELVAPEEPARGNAEAVVEMMAADVLRCPLPEYGVAAVFCCAANCGDGQPTEEHVLLQMPE